MPYEASDAGRHYTCVQTYTTSADMTTAAPITAAPGTGRNLILNDLLVCSAADMYLTLLEETSGTVLGVLALLAGVQQQVTLRDGLVVPTEGKRLFAQASGAGTLHITASQRDDK